MRKPGIVPILNGNMNLLEVLAQSGDLTDFASRDDIRILRGDLRNPEILNINLSSLNAIMLSSLILKPNDIVWTVPNTFVASTMSLLKRFYQLRNLLLIYF